MQKFSLLPPNALDMFRIGRIELCTLLLILIQVILLEHEIPYESFSGKVLACLPPDNWAITPENSIGRKDLRHLPVLSIDPPGCKDIDDALHARTLENGNLEARYIVTFSEIMQPPKSIVCAFLPSFSIPFQ